MQPLPLLSLLLVPLAALQDSGASPSPASPPLARKVDLLRQLESLRSGDAFDRQRGEVEIRRLGEDALPVLARELEDGDRLYRFRIERLFGAILETFLLRLESEFQALFHDRNEVEALERARAATALRRELRAQIQRLRADDPRIEERLAALLRLQELEAAAGATTGNAPALDAETKRSIERLRGEKEAWFRELPDIERKLEPVLRLAADPLLRSAGGEFGEKEELRLKELKERIGERLPRTQALRARLEEFGLPALNGLLARKVGALERLAPVYDELVAGAAAKLGDALADTDDSTPAFDRRRYSRALLWARAAAGEGPAAVKAQALIRKHVQAVLRDLHDPETLFAERAADELYVLGGAGHDALAEDLRRQEAEGHAPDRFLLGLLRWRIPPATYARIGIDFAGFEDLPFRTRRRKVLDYARVAKAEAVPTLRAIVSDESLEPSLFVKLAAAKALLGLRDSTGYAFLVAKYPDITLRKPEFSLELMIIQGVEYLQDKEYERAVEELRKVLDEEPFNFPANYHIAFAYLLLKDYPRAIHHFEVARRIHRKDQLTLYNLACAYALGGGKSAQALDVLEEAVEAGFDDHEHMENDPDLTSLRQEERYRSLIERLRGQKP